MANIYKPQRGSPIILGHPLAPDLLCLLLNDGSGNIAHDISGQDNHGTLTNMADTDWVGSAMGGVLNFAASNEYIALPSVPALSGTSGTISAWVYLESYGDAGDPYIRNIYCNDFSGNLKGFGFRVGSDGSSGGKDKIHFHVVAGADDRNNANGGVVSLNEWHFVAGVYNGANAIVYLDNVKTTGDADSDAIAAPTQAEIGGRGGGRLWDGLIAQVCIWNRALSDDELALLLAAPYCFIDQGEMDWLSMLGAAAPTTFPYYYQLLLANRQGRVA